MTRLQSVVMALSAALGVLLGPATVQATPVTNPALVPSGSTTITFSEVSLTTGAVVTTEFTAYGVVFAATPSSAAPSSATMTTSSTVTAAARPA